MGLAAADAAPTRSFGVRLDAFAAPLEPAQPAEQAFRQQEDVHYDVEAPADRYVLLRRQCLPLRTGSKALAPLPACDVHACSF